MSETKNLKLKKHDNVETNTNNFDIENYLNGNWDKIDEKDGKINQTIQTLQTENTRIKEQNEKLKEDLKGLPNAKVSGESIDIKDSAEMRVLEFGVGGNSRQESREKNNIFKSDLEQGGITGSTGANQGSDVRLRTKDFIEVKPNTKYIVKMTGKNLMLFVFEYSSNSISGFVQRTPDNWTSDIPFSFTTSSTTKYIKVLVAFQDSSVITTSEVTDLEIYEPILPSPEYPSEVVSCGDNVNLFDKDNINVLNAYLANNKTIASTNYVKTYYFECKANTSYTISKIVGKYFRVGTISKMPEINDTLLQIIADDNNTNITIKTDSNAKYLLFNCRNNQTDTLTEQEILDSIKVEQGSTLTPYSQYRQGNINVEMCDMNFYTEKNLQNAGLDTSTGNTNTSESWRTTDYIYMPLNHFWILWESNSTYFQARVVFYDFNKEFISGTSIAKSNTYKYEIDKPENCVFIRLSYSVKVNNEEAKREKIQIVENEIDILNKYEPHKSQTYTIPTQQPMLEDDYFDWENKEEVHIWGKYNFTGSEYFSVIAPGIYRYNAKANNLGIKSVNNGVVAKAICNRLKVETAAHISSGLDYNNHFGISTTGTIDINMQDYETVEKFKAKLKELYDEGAPLYIWYELEEEKILPFTEEQKEVAKELENAKTYKGVTHIYSTDKVSPNMEVTYLKDIEMMINNIATTVEEGE